MNICKRAASHKQRVGRPSPHPLLLSSPLSNAEIKKGGAFSTFGKHLFSYSFHILSSNEHYVPEYGTLHIGCTDCKARQHARVARPGASTRSSNRSGPPKSGGPMRRARRWPSVYTRLAVALLLLSLLPVCRLLSIGRNHFGETYKCPLHTNTRQMGARSQQR